MTNANDMKATRDEFDRRRQAGLRERHQQRLHRTDHTCTNCTARGYVCRAKLALSGRPCCRRCTHSTRTPSEHEEAS